MATVLARLNELVPIYLSPSKNLLITNQMTPAELKEARHLFAVSGGISRWKGKSKKEKTAHAKKMVDAREAKKHTNGVPPTHQPNT